MNLVLFKKDKQRKMWFEILIKISVSYRYWEVSSVILKNICNNSNMLLYIVLNAKSFFFLPHTYFKLGEMFDF